jgi:hypothetical protein
MSDNASAWIGNAHVAANAERDAELARLTAENARLREALTEMLPRYCEMFSALELGDPEIDSVAVDIARKAL